MWPDAFWFHWLISLDVPLEFEKSLVVSVGYFQINHENDSLTIFSKGPITLIISNPVPFYWKVWCILDLPVSFVLGWLGLTWVWLAEVWGIQRRRKMRKKMRKMRNDSLAKCDVGKKRNGSRQSFRESFVIFTLFFLSDDVVHSSIRMKNPRAII